MLLPRLEELLKKQESIQEQLYETELCPSLSCGHGHRSHGNSGGQVSGHFHARTWCADDSILGRFQPAGLTNERLLGFAASAELLIVLLILFSSRRWLSCLAAAAWGLLCFLARLFLMDPYGNCRCLGWLAKPGPTTNLVAALLALSLAGAGWLAFRNAWHSEKSPKVG